MTQTIIWTIAIISVLGAVLAVVLYLVAKKFKVEEDPRIDQVEKVLPGANCGGCGQAGCHAFAQHCVESPDLGSCFCPVGGNDVMQKVADVLGLKVEAKEPMVAVVRCNGSCENRPEKWIAASFDGDLHAGQDGYVAGPNLLAPHGAGLAVDQNLSLLDEDLGLPAAAHHVGQLQQGV